MRRAAQVSRRNNSEVSGAFKKRSVCYRAEPLPVSRVSAEWPRSNIAALTQAFASKATPWMKAPDLDVYVPVRCLACEIQHLVNPKTGMVLDAGGTPGES